MTIAFRDGAAHENTASGTDVSVTVPGTIQANDGLLAFYTVAGTGATATTPSGWTQVLGPIDKSTVLRLYVYAKVAVAGDAGATLTVTKSVSDATKRDVTVVAYSGVDSTNWVANVSANIQSLVETTAGTTHSIPSITITGSTNWLGEFVVDRASPSSSSFTQSASYTSRVQLAGSGSGTCSTAWFDSNAAVSSGTHSGDSVTGTVSTANAITVAIVIEPAGGTSATATPATVAGLVSIPTPTVSNGANITVHPVTVLGVVSFPPLTGQVTSTMFPDTVAGTTTIPSPTEQAVQTALVIPDLVILGAATIGTPTIVAVDNSGGGGGGGGGGGTPSTTRAFVGPVRIETWPLAPGARIAVKVTVNQTLYRKNGVWLVGENLNWTDLVGVDRLYQGGATPPLTDAQLDELIAEGQGQYVVTSTDPFPSTFTGTF